MIMQFQDHIQHTNACVIDEEIIGIPVQFTVTHKYANFSELDIGIVFSNNIVARIDATADRFTTQNKLLVRTVYHFYSRNALNNTLAVNEHQLMRGRSDGKQDDESLSDLALAIKKLREMVKDVSYPVFEVRVILDRHIDTRRIKEKGWLYLPQENIVVSDILSTGVTHHPFSSKAQVEQGKQKFQGQQNGTGIIVEVVDNDNEFDRCFVWLGKAVIEVPVRKDPSKKSGVYVTRATLDEHTKVTQHNTQLLDFQSAQEQLGIYRTKDEANSNGNPENLHKLEEQRLRNENIRLSAERLQYERELEEQKRKTQELNARIVELEHELKIQKLKAERESTEAKARTNAEQARNDSAKAAIEAEAMRRKDHYEEKKTIRDDFSESRSHARKDSSEWLKWVAGIAAAALSIGAAAYTFTATSSFVSGLAGSLWSSISSTAKTAACSGVETVVQTAEGLYDFAAQSISSGASAVGNFVKSGLDKVATFASGIFSGFCSLF